MDKSDSNHKQNRLTEELMKEISSSYRQRKEDFDYLKEAVIKVDQSFQMSD